MAEGRIADSLIDQESAPLTEQDRVRLAYVEPSLERGRALRKWWKDTAGRWSGRLAEELDEILRQGPFEDRFRLVRRYIRFQEEASYGFFDRAPIGGREIPVMGAVQQMYFDEPKLHPVEAALRPILSDEELVQGRKTAIRAWRDNLGAFVLGYFLRQSSYRRLAPFVDETRRRIEPFLRPVSWCPEDEGRKGGLGFNQVYYKRLDSGQVGKFHLADRHRIDLRELAFRHRYAWIVIAAHVYGVDLAFMPAGMKAPFVVVPRVEERYGIISPDFVHHLDDGDAGDSRARYGFGYVLLGDPTDRDAGMVAGGSPEDVGFQAFDFLVQEDGKILTQMSFVKNRSEKLFHFNLNPFYWGLEAADRMSQKVFSMVFGPLKRLARRIPFAGSDVDPFLGLVRTANLVTGGFAARELCVSKAQLEKTLLTDYVIAQMEMMIFARAPWRLVPDWTRHEDLPEWATSGKDPS